MALDAAGIERRVPYALRHTFASLAIAAGGSLFELSRFMGTSPQMLDKTYGHLLPDALDRGRAALDSFVAATPPRRLGTEWAQSSRLPEWKSLARAGLSYRGARI